MGHCRPLTLGEERSPASANETPAPGDSQPMGQGGIVGGGREGSATLQAKFSPLAVNSTWFKEGQNEGGWGIYITGGDDISYLLRIL